MRKLFYHILLAPMEETPQKVFAESSLANKHGSFKNRQYQFENPRIINADVLTEEIN